MITFFIINKIFLKLFSKVSWKSSNSWTNNLITYNSSYQHHIISSTVAKNNAGEKYFSGLVRVKFLTQTQLVFPKSWTRKLELNPCPLFFCSNPTRYSKNQKLTTL